MERLWPLLVLTTVLGALVGSVLAVAFFGLLRSRDVDLIIALPLAAMAFFFGGMLVTTVIRIVMSVAYLWRMRR